MNRRTVRDTATKVNMYFNIVCYQVPYTCYYPSLNIQVLEAKFCLIKP